MGNNKLTKEERIKKDKIIEELFSPGSNSFYHHPIRIVYRITEQIDAPVAILISVSKKRFNLAVDRNRIKRQLREAYRKNKEELLEEVKRQNKKVSIAFIYQGKSILPTREVEEQLKKGLLDLALTLKKDDK